MDSSTSFFLAKNLILRLEKTLDSSLFQVWFLWSKSTVPAFLDKEEVVQIFGENPEEGEEDEETQDENNKSGENT